MINIEDLDKIITIVEKHNLSHFEFEQEKSKVVIEIGSTVKPALNENSTIVSGVIEAAEEKINKEDINSQEKDSNKTFIKSSLAGTFYLRKNENEDCFVKIHDIVDENTIVGLVEVMKLFNDVEAGVNGEIVDILVKDGDFVEYGQPLFEVKLN